MGVNMIYYPTVLRRVQITPKTSTNIARYLHSSGPVRQVCLLLTNQSKYGTTRKNTTKSHVINFDSPCGTGLWSKPRGLQSGIMWRIVGVSNCK